MDISLVVTDLDGTLMTDTYVISPQDLDAIYHLAEKGIPLAFATGRIFGGAIAVIEKYNLQKEVKHLIHTGGVYTYDVFDGSEHSQAHLEPHEQKAVFHAYKDFGVPVVIVENGVFYTSVLTDKVIEQSKVYGCTIEHVPDFDRLLTKPLSKLIYCGEGESFHKMVEATRTNPHTFCDFFLSGDYYLDCNAKGVNKGVALSELCNRMGYDITKTIALGDNFNDLDMLQTAGKSGCPSTSPSALLEMVDFISPPCHAGAFASFVDHFINL